MSDHPIVHIEFSAGSLEDAAEFYREAFNWEIKHISEMNYVTFEADPGPGGGFSKVDDEMIKAGDVIVYIQTSDIEASLTKIESLGGKTLLPKTEIPTIGWFAFFADPTGNRIALFTGLEG